ncbi:MAG: riboflavin kinase [Patescibacteria group bacterium]|nr:riboflavin kinase [Patescibacteria group bacterium]
MFEILGKVVPGEKIGRRLGFPTANLDRRQFVRSQQKIRLGVWAGKAVLPQGKIFKAGIVIGPLDKRGLPKIEAHLLGFSGNLYGKKLSLTLHLYLRPFKEYENERLLQKQIAKDIARIKALKV